MNAGAAVLCALLLSGAVHAVAPAAAPAVAPVVYPKAVPCQLVAHLNETEPAAARQADAGSADTLPRWYNLHYRLLKLLSDQAGCSLTVVGSPWPRSLTLLKNGQIDLMLTMSYTSQRESYADFIGAHYLEETVLVVEAAAAGKVQRLADILLLAGPVAVLRDAWYGPEFAALSQGDEVKPMLQYVNSVAQKLQLLEKGRVAGVVIDKSQFLEWRRLHPALAARYTISQTINKEPVYIVASRAGVPFPLRQRLKQAWFEVSGGPAHRAILQEFGWSLE